MKTTIKEIFREILPQGSFAMARRNIGESSVRFNGEQVTSMDQEVEVDLGSILQIGKRQTFQRGGGQWVKLVPFDPNAKYQLKLGRSDDKENPPISVGIQHSQGIEISAEGYGDETSPDGHGCPLFIEYYDGRLNLMIWADINKEDPTHIISLEGAREDVRARQESLNDLTNGQGGCIV